MIGSENGGLDKIGLDKIIEVVFLSSGDVVENKLK